MPYTRPSDTEQLSSEAINALAEAAGLSLPPEDLESLAKSLTSQFACMDMLDQLDLAHVQPALQFDPRWPADRHSTQTQQAKEAGREPVR